MSDDMNPTWRYSLTSRTFLVEHPSGRDKVNDPFWLWSSLSDFGSRAPSHSRQWGNQSSFTAVP